MRGGAFTYIRLLIKTAVRHSFHAAHSILLGLLIATGLLTYFVPQVEVVVDLHGWQVAAAVLVGIVAVRLALSPYWIWRDDQTRIAALQSQIEEYQSQREERAAAAAKKAARDVLLDQIANEISWAIDNLVNPKPSPLSTPYPDGAISVFEQKCNDWVEKVNKLLENAEVFNQRDRTDFSHLGFIQPIQMTQNTRLDHIFSQLNLRLDRLREVERRARERNAG
jgi:hypothetical protein